jgi:hypothetical protein
MVGGYEYGIYVFVWTWVLVSWTVDLGLSVTSMRLIHCRETGDSAHRGLCAARAGLHSAWAR